VRFDHGYTLGASVQATTSCKASVQVFASNFEWKNRFDRVFAAANGGKSGVPKTIAAISANEPRKGLEGATTFTYDANSNLTMLDRGRKQSGGQNVTYFQYDLEGQIIARSDQPGTGSIAGIFAGYTSDPDVGVPVGDNGNPGTDYSQT
jgi:hypothetical protein